MNCLELFAGAGGAALGLERYGLTHAGLVEMDPNACNTLRAVGYDHVIEGDVRDHDAIARVVGGTPINMVWSSFPCQAFSIAGQRKGARDERNGWPWTVGVLDKYKPTYFIGENVMGLTHHVADCDRQGDPEACPACYLDRLILPQLAERFAYTGYIRLDAADFGVPQHRRRIFLYGAPHPVIPPRATHGPGMFTKPWVSMGEALQLGTQRVVGGGSNPNKTYPVRSYRDLTDEPSTTMSAAQIGNAGPWVVGFSERQNGTRGRTPIAADRPCPTIQAGSHRDNGLRVHLLERPSPTVTTTEVKGTRGATMRSSPDRGSDVLFLATGRRRLTVAECAKLQGFPDGYADKLQGTVASKYRQVGNAVPPKMAEVIARAVLNPR